MTITRTLSNALNAELKTAGFKRKGATWYLRNDDIIAVVNLQKSNYDATHFLNLGFWIRAIEDVENPREAQCHVHVRAEGLWPCDSPMITDLLSFDAVADCDDERLVDIQQFVRAKVIPFLTRGSSLAGLREIIEEYKGVQIRRVAWQSLGVEGP